MEPRVAYECVAPEHQAAGGAPDKLTVHRGEWAFCPYDARSEGHVWKRSEGGSLAVLSRQAGLKVRPGRGENETP